MGKFVISLILLTIFVPSPGDASGGTNCAGHAQIGSPEVSPPPVVATTGESQFHNWVDELNAASTAAIAVFTVALFWGVFYQARNTRDVERAWIIKESLSSPEQLRYFSPTYIDSNAMRVTLALKNNGRTPARITESSAYFELIGDPVDLPKIPDYRPEALSSGYPRGGLIVVPNETVNLVIDYLDGRKRFEPSDFKGLREGAKQLSIWGFIAYQDAFKRKHRLSFCYLYKPAKEGNVWRGEFKLGGPAAYNRHT